MSDERKKHNDLILDRLRGVSPKSGTAKDRLDPQNPNTPTADNDK